MNHIIDIFNQINSLEVNMVNCMFRLVLSMFLGMIVGAERKRKGQIAGIWMTAIIGMAVGIGMYLCSIGATLLILLTLVTFEQYEKRRKLGQESKVINLTVEGIVGDIENYREVFRQHNVHLSTFYIEYDYEHNRTHLDFVVLAHAYADLLPMLNSVGEAGATRRLTLSSQIDI